MHLIVALLIFFAAKPLQNCINILLNANQITYLETHSLSWYFYNIMRNKHFKRGKQDIKNINITQIDKRETKSTNRNIKSGKFRNKIVSDHILNPLNLVYVLPLLVFV